MSRVMPDSIPQSLHDAAWAAIVKTDESISRRNRAQDAYRSDEFRRRAARLPRGHVMFDELLGLAQGLVDWGMMVRKSLPIERLTNRFRTLGGRCKSLSVVHHEFFFDPYDGFTGGRLWTQLELELDAEIGLFRHDAWFDGFRMTEGGLLNSASDLQEALHPEVLSQIHRLVADGQNVRHIELDFGRLADEHKDR